LYTPIPQNSSRQARKESQSPQKGNIGLSSHNLANFAYLRSFARGLPKEINFRIFPRQARKESQSPKRGI